MNSDPLRDAAVLVTGGAGFIGSHLVDALVERGARVRVLDNLSTGSLRNLEHLGSAIDWMEGDIRSTEDCRRACDGVELVFHQAALGSVPRSLEDPVTTWDVNALGTVRLLAAAVGAGVRRVVYASSSSVYGDSDALPKCEGEEGRPLSPYAASKVAGEQAAMAFTAALNVETVGLRYFNVYGPRQDPEGPYAAVIPRFFKACFRGESTVIYGDGEQSRDFTYVADAVGANLLAVATLHTGVGQSYNVAGGRATSVRELARRVAESTGATDRLRFEDPRLGDVRHSLADLTAAGRDLAYAPRHDLARGLRSTLDYYRSLFEELPDS